MKHPFPAYAALLLVALVLAGCGKTVIPHGGGHDSITLFTPLRSHTAQTLSDAEALQLVRQLSPQRQGLDSWTDLDAAVRQSLAFAQRRPATATAISFPGLTATWADIAAGTATLLSLLPSLDANPDLLAHSFRWVRLGPDFGFTGYCEPVLRASRTPVGELQQPLYAKPPELRDKAPYFTRHQIDRQGALRGRNLEIAYVDPTDAFFLHIQGSGRLRFDDGSTIHVLYAGKNNRAYVSLGRIMKERGILPEGGVSMQAIRQYLAENPDQRAPLFDENPSYVFFRPEVYGPIGSMGATLTPWVSLAVDRRVMPQGCVTMVLVPLPGPTGQHTRPFPALTLPHDSGGAIKGHRIDIFCGAGEAAEHVAGHLDIKGAVYLLLPRR